MNYYNKINSGNIKNEIDYVVLFLFAFFRPLTLVLRKIRLFGFNVLELFPVIISYFSLIIISFNIKLHKIDYFNSSNYDVCIELAPYSPRHSRRYKQYVYEFQSEMIHPKDLKSGGRNGYKGNPHGAEQEVQFAKGVRRYPLIPWMFGSQPEGHQEGIRFYPRRSSMGGNGNVGVFLGL